MSRDIRSFFTVTSKKTDSKSPLAAAAAKKRPIVIDSSDEDIVEASPVPVKNKTNIKSKKRKVIDSDSDDENKKPSTNKTDNKKKVLAADVFGSAPIKQTKVEKKEPSISTNTQGSTNKTENKLKLQTELGVHDDPSFEQSLLDLDNDILLENVSVLDKTIEEELNNTSMSSSSSKKTSFSNRQQKRKVEDCNDDGIDKDQERFEKKRHSALLYQRYLNRSAPKNHGAKEYPKGKPDCLKGLCFLKTGVLDSLEHEEFDELIEKHGGRTVKAVSKKVNYVVVGEDAGPAKLEKAHNYKIPNISEDELLDLILTKSGLPPKYSKIVSDDKPKEQEPSNSEHKNKTPSPKKTQSPPENTLSKKSPEKAIQSKELKKSPEKAIQSKELKKPSLKNLNKDIKEDHIEKNSLKHESLTDKSENKLKKDSNAVDISKQKNDSNNATSEVKIKKESFYSKTDSNYAEGNKQKNDSNDATEIKIKKENFYSKTDRQEQNEISKEKQEVLQPRNENLSWADKYKPQNIKAIIGQHGDKSCMNKLLYWLKKWPDNHLGKNKPKLVKPSPWVKNDDGAYFKCALLSGPPGIGKTTTATLVAKELGYDIVEFNASDTRSKKLLHEEVSQLLSTNSLKSFMKDGSAPTKKHVLLMDEVDGMAGNEDRGGMQELIALIKNTSVPIICMCNDRNHQKMRSLVNYCFDLRFSKPNLGQIKGAMMSVCFKEGLKISPDALTEIIAGTDMDIRQTLNHLSMWTINNKHLSAEEAKQQAAAAKKDITLGPWEVIRKVFTESEQKTMSIGDKFRLFFYDYSIGPLFVQENYLQVQPNCSKKDLLQRVADTADAISVSDLVDKKMRTSNNWSLLEVQAIFSSVLPGHYMSGRFKGQINFPGWLGKNSRKNKIKRLVSELQSHTRTCTTGSRKAINLDYIYHWRNNIVNPLKEKGTDGIERSLSVMNSYNLLRQDLDNVLEASHWARQKDPMAMIDSKVKMAFTRTYNKNSAKLPYAISSASIKKKTSAALDDSLYGESQNDSAPEEEDDDVTKDAMIKAKKPAKGKTAVSEASSSKKTGSKGGGRGKGSKKN